MKDRIKEIRKQFKITQQQFADRIGMKQNTIATFEIGKVVPSDRTLLSICREFGVNEHWLRTGEGHMMEEATERELYVTDLFAKALAAKGVDSLQMRLVECVLNLTPAQIEAIAEVAQSFVSTLNAKNEESPD